MIAIFFSATGRLCVPLLLLECGFGFGRDLFESAIGLRKEHDASQRDLEPAQPILQPLIAAVTLAGGDPCVDPSATTTHA